MLKRFFYGVSLLNTFFSVNLFAQYIEPRKIISPSPLVSTYQRYGEFPVNLSTGSAQISIPLYEIKIKDFNFPIDISFNASGRRTDFGFSAMGVGWLLNASGYISREIRDRPDEFASGGMELSTDDLCCDPLARYNKLLPADVTVPGDPLNKNFLRDAEHDVYSYNVNGLQGKFVINDMGQAVPLTSTSVHIVGNSSITDERGIRYEFGGADATETGVSAEATVGNNPRSVQTTWHLNRIVLPSGEIINFYYNNKFTGSPMSGVTAPYNYNIGVTSGSANAVATQKTNSEMANFIYKYNGVQANSTGNTSRDYKICYLSSITFNGGMIGFDYDPTSLALKSMRFSATSITYTKKADFVYINTPGTTGSFPNNNSISLSELTFKGEEGALTEKYKFNYYDNPLSFSNNWGDFYIKRDWWGYSNDTGDKSPVTEFGGPNIGSYGCTNCKTPSFNNRVSGMLKKITYPSGGNTEFIYENNKYSQTNNGNGEDGPGLRIKQIISDGGNGSKLTKTYKYGENENGTGRLLHVPNPRDFKLYESFINYYPWEGMVLFGGTYALTTFLMTPADIVAEGYRQPVYYSMVTEYTESAAGDNNGKTVYKYSIPEAVISFLGGTGSFRMKTWTGNKLLYKELYKFRAAENDYKLIERDQNEYITLDYKKIPQIRMRRNWRIMYEFDNYHFRPLEMGHAQLTGSYTNYGSLFDVIDNPIESAVEKVKTYTNTTFNDLGIAVEKKVDYFYDNLAHLQPTRTETSLSIGTDKLIEETKYSMDFSNSSLNTPMGNAINNLKNKFIIAPIEKSTYRSLLNESGKRLLNSQLFVYNPSLPVLDSIMTIDIDAPIMNFTPISTSTFNVDYRYKSRHFFDSYDSRLNLLQQHKASGVYSSYIWDLWKKYPIAEVINASYNNIFFEGFEDASGPDITISVHKTGRKSRSNNYTKTLTGLSSGKYTLSYWKQENGVWSAVTIDNISVTGDSYTINITVAGWIDDVRFYPADSKMKTYTYLSTIGMTSETEPNLLITSYEYDDLGRLTFVKDSNGNIIKSYDYHYRP